MCSSLDSSPEEMLNSHEPQRSMAEEPQLYSLDVTLTSHQVPPGLRSTCFILSEGRPLPTLAPQSWTSGPQNGEQYISVFYQPPSLLCPVIATQTY